MLTGTVPFKANNMKELHKMIMKGQFQPIVDLSEGNSTYNSIEASSLLYSLLEVDPKKRFTIDKILDHPWMNNADNRMKFKSKKLCLLVVNLFTAAEKLLLVKSNIDYRKGNKEDLIENFSLRNLDTLQEAENQNVNTKSVILAPFNSSLKHESFKYEDLAIANSVLKFNGKVRELNRNYELNNNGEIDNGVIISPQGN